MKNVVFSKLRNLDACPKVNEDFYSSTLSGGIITLISSLSIMLLVFSEFRLYLHTVIETKLLVDTSIGETFRIYVKSSSRKRIMLLQRKGREKKGEREGKERGPEIGETERGRERGERAEEEEMVKGLIVF